MGTVAVLGERHRIEALALAGAEPHPAETPDEAVSAWSELGPDVSILIVTPAAERALAAHAGERRDLMITVLP
jgi:vacuolar-type H+-ATPase subunit F/Vma7